MENVGREVGGNLFFTFFLIEKNRKLVKITKNSAVIITYSSIDTGMLPCYYISNIPVLQVDRLKR